MNITQSLTIIPGCHSNVSFIYIPSDSPDNQLGQRFWFCVFLKIPYTNNAAHSFDIKIKNDYQNSTKEHRKFHQNMKTRTVKETTQTGHHEILLFFLEEKFG